jgi:Na+-driven multidrug efflux pump
MLTAVLLVGLIVFAPLLCVVPFGQEFSESTNQLRVLALGAFGVVALKQLGSSLTGRAHPTAASAAIGSAFVCTVLLDILLIPSLGGLGAAIASSTAYTIGGIVMAIVFARALRSPVTTLLPRAADVREVFELLRRLLQRRSVKAPVPEELTPTPAP